MKLSIITCTYNSEKFLQKSIDSVILQNLDTHIYEHIFIDGYSTDNTLKIIEKYQQKYHNVRVFNRKPKGVYNAMNEGIKQSKGEYIYCLNSDDYLEPNILKDYLSFIENTGDKDIYYGISNNIVNGKIEYGGNKFLPVKKFLFKHFGCNILVFHHTVLAKKSTLIEMGLFDENKKILADYGMRLKMLRNKKDFIYFPKTVTNFRKWEGSISSGKSEIGRKEREYYQKKYFSPYKLIIINIINRLIKLYSRILRIYRKVLDN